MTMTNTKEPTKKSGRPRKRVLTPPAPVVEDGKAAVVPNTVEETKYSKRPIMSGNTEKITITVSEDGSSRHIDCGGLTIYETMMTVKGVYAFLFNELKKESGLNGVEEGTADTSGGSNT